MTASTIDRLECGKCRTHHDPNVPQRTCTVCGGPLLVRYAAPSAPLSLEAVMARPPGQERLHEFSPLGGEGRSLGEGATPLVAAPRLAEALNIPGLLLKDESQNPTASFKSRGMAAAIGRAHALSIEAVCLPSAGNAGGAAAAYGALYGLDVHVYVPESTPEPIVAETRALGAEVVLVEGTIADAGKALAPKAEAKGWFPLSTLREPYRIEGKKVMGYELLYDLGRLPDVVIYPTGGGTGLIGMWKAFEEMEGLGWIGPERPKMVSVQTAGCAPIVRAFEQGLDHAPVWEQPELTRAFGLRVPGALGDFLILDAVRKSGGCAVAVLEDDLVAHTELLHRRSGLQGAEETGACLAAARKLREDGLISPDDQVVVFNTGHAMKYA